ncbi:hypothetical protein ANO11243_094280 [Dothideomycetidae sp. 11243]|nr:hypothetical protein ANO11243_094280 [fungal sp. No.11243]
MVTSVISGLLYMPLGCFTCAEFKVFPGLPNHCPGAVQHAASSLFVIFSVTQIVGDVVLSLLACIALWGGKMPLPTKISGIFLLCIGSCGGVASAVRLYFFLDPANINTYTQQTMALVRCVLIELGTCVIAANLAMIKPLFQALLLKAGLISDLHSGPASGIPNMALKTLHAADRGNSSVSSDPDLGQVQVEGKGTVTRVVMPLGNVMTATFAQSRVDQELAKEGVVPFPRFWASSWLFGSPSAGLLLHFIPSFIVIVAIPLRDAYNFILDVEGYPSSVINFFVVVGFFWMRYSASNQPRLFKVWLPVAVFYLVAEAFLLVAPSLRPPGGKGDTSLPYWL